MGDLLRDHMTTWGVLLILAMAACGPEQTSSAPELVLSHQVATWFQDGWSFYDVSPDEDEGVFGARFGRTLFDLERGVERRDRLDDSLESVADAFFDVEGRLWRRGTQDGDVGWWVPGPDGPRRASLPADAAPRMSADGTRVAYYRGTAGSGPRLWVGSLEAPVGHDLDGLVTGVGWSPDGVPRMRCPSGPTASAAVSR